MDAGYQSYALCWMPKLYSDLAEFGCAWTGWCPETGIKAALCQQLRDARKIAGPSGDTGRRGLHAPLTEAFTLRTDGQLWALENALGALANDLREVPIGRLQMRVIAGRIMLTPRDEHPAREFLETLGALMSSFGIRARERFELAVTDTLMGDDADRVARALEPVLAAMLARPLTLSDVALMGDPGDSRPWRLTERFQLCRTPQRTTGPSGMHCFGVDQTIPIGNTEIVR